MKIKYLGESCKGKGDRFAEIIFKANGNIDDIVSDVLHSFEDDGLISEFNGFGDYDESYYLVAVEDKEEYQAFSKAFRKSFKERKGV